MSDLALDQADELYAAVGFRITRIRKARGLTQDDLAAAVTLTRSSIANTETGRQRIQLHTLLTIAQALGVEMAELLDIGRPMPVLAERLPQGPRDAVAEAVKAIEAAQSALARSGDALRPFVGDGEP